MFNNQDVQKLRNETGCGMLECKKALEETNGDFQQAILVLRKLGFKIEEIRAGKETNCGLIHSYVHNNKIGVLVEIGCETDFAANTDKMKEFAHDVAMQIAAMQPKYLNRESVDATDLQIEKDFIADQCRKENKPENMIEKITIGKLNKFYSQNCLMEQPFIKNDKTCLKNILSDLISSLKENINIKRYIRWEIGR